MEAPKTKDFINIAKNLKVDDKKVLLVLPKVEKNVYLSARNLQKAEVMTASAINTYKILNADVLVIAESSLQAIDEVLTK
jgi:large subunit ribosomal protein L4